MGPQRRPRRRASGHPVHRDWGGTDDPWHATISLEDAKHLVKTYKLGSKEIWVPLTIEHVGRSVRVVRSRDTGHSAISTVCVDTFVEFPKVRDILAAKDTVAPAAGFNLNAKYLADFAKVRPRGPLVMRFTGEHSLIHLSIGERFAGAIQPIRDDERLAGTPKPETASDVLRHGAGVLLSTTPTEPEDGD